mgnify:CR=1 FL=1
MIETAYQWLYTIALSVLGIGLFFCLARAIIGPRIADRIVAVNMVGTSTICIIAVLALMMGEGYLADISLIYTMLSFLAAGVVNFFVPSGGGQWAVQGPIMMPAARAQGISDGLMSMAIAWGDQWTNMIQPFWALPALGIAGLSARDVMGYLVVILLFTGVLACGGFLVWGLL